jgi:hypothetical protein
MAAPRTQAIKAGSILRPAGEQAVNVKAYGGLGDGVTNDTAAFIEASAGVRLSHPGSH